MSLVRHPLGKQIRGAMSNLLINFAPISVRGDTTVLVGRQPYDKDRLNELRREFRETHVFRRDGIDDVIIDIPVVAGQSPIGDVQEEIDLAKHYRLLHTLLSAALIRVFHGSRDIFSVGPVGVLGDARRGLIRHPDLPEWMQKRSLMKFDTRTIYPTDGTPILGLVCDIRVKNLILESCQKLLELGISLHGRYVQVEEGYDPRLMKKRRLIGRVEAVEGNSLVLGDHAEGYESVSASESFLEARREIFDACVRHILGGAAERIIAKAEESAAELHSGPGRKKRVEDILAYLRKNAMLEAVPSARFVIGDMLASGKKGFPATNILSRPNLVFDPSGSRKDVWSERGLKSNGPYDQRTFSPKQLRIAVVCQARHEGQVDRFVAKFLDGMPEVFTGYGERSAARYGDGFLRRFRLEKPKVEFFTAASESAEDYVAASRRALERAADGGYKWNLALVQVEEEFKSLDTKGNPYFATKSLFLKRDVAVQSVRLETMSRPDTELVFPMNDVSLAAYAKLGGVPWLLAAQQSVAHELVVGIGSHSVSNSRIGSQRRFVGITTVFSSDGNYLLSDKTAVVPFEEYADALYQTLKRSITTVRKQDNWRSTDKVRLVFHMFKPPKDTEADSIKRTVEDLGLENVTFAFVHVAPSHPFIIFDLAQRGIGYQAPKKGDLGPTRGLHLKLGDYESLMVFSGVNELKRASDGMPRPCLLKLHRLSTFKDMTYLARQAFEFSGHSWRMLSPERYPITVRYSDLIAQRLAALGDVPGWDDDAVHLGQIGRTLWFL